MIRSTITLAILATAGVGVALAAPASPAAERKALAAAVASPARSEANRARDVYRHPQQTLAFFGVRPKQTVVELIPGGGWYSEILAPYVLNGGGTYYVAAPNERGLGGFQRLVQKDAALYGRARQVIFPVRDAGQAKVPDGSADVVLTFRNVHNWAMGDQPYAAEAFQQIYAMLKPGGVLGIEEHRLPEKADSAREKSSGYLKVSTVRRLAEQAGFRFAGSSEINANRKDTADHPEGVWTLPPTLRLGDKDRAKYLAIGESDRMTLKFVKPR
ncbi:class I SAM-dependent methyltransferase [Sphingomonas astaxanthinifaciens]|uniref:Methyltransferase n=1 Tax=Sphingomonas astaxanthinifaciens DSM 22298 TaxID=1123267 RepID=A0ABQ5Z5N6_9SPHN|nr:methyltransferase domain-containing protein [Sphingomonas astaxanthinifaciens]GLR46940.1 methyltransferase [Sphingomonas astaxanthinifaciens DSM 22298]